MNSPIDLERLEAIFHEMLLDVGCAIALDAPDGKVTVPADLAASTIGLLPVFMIAADACWKQRTGAGLGIDIVPDEEALLFYRLRAVLHAPLTAVLLALTEVIEQRPADGPLVAATPIEAWTRARAAAPAA